MVVVLPAPLGPRSANTSPRSTWTSMPRDGLHVAVGLAQALRSRSRARPRDRAYPTPKPASVSTWLRSGSPRDEPAEVVDEYRRPPLLPPAQVAGDVGRDHHLGHRPQGRIVGGRGSCTKTSSAAPAIVPSRTASISAASSTVRPRPTLTKNAVGRIAAKAFASKIAVVAGGQRQRIEHMVGATERLVEAIGSGDRAEDVVGPGGTADGLDGHPEGPRTESRGAADRTRADHDQVATGDRVATAPVGPTTGSPESTIDACKPVVNATIAPIAHSAIGSSNTPRAFVTTTSLDASSGKSNPSTPVAGGLHPPQPGGRRERVTEPRTRRTPEEDGVRVGDRGRRPRRRSPRTAARPGLRPARSRAAARPRSRRGRRRAASAKSQRLPPAEPAVHAVVVRRRRPHPAASTGTPARRRARPGSRQAGVGDRAAGCRARRGTRPRSCSVSWCRNQSDPATPPPSAATASVIRSLDAIRPSRASRSRGSRSRSSASSPLASSTVKTRSVVMRPLAPGRAAREGPRSACRRMSGNRSRRSMSTAIIPSAVGGLDVELGVVADVHRVGRARAPSRSSASRRSAGPASRRPRRPLITRTGNRSRTPSTPSRSSSQASKFDTIAEHQTRRPPSSSSAGTTSSNSDVVRRIGERRVQDVGERAVVGGCRAPSSIRSYTHFQKRAERSGDVVQSSPSRAASREPMEDGA